MTAVIIQAEDGRQARISEPDEDGDYGWDCEACGASESDHGYQPLEDTIQNASNHLDHHCTEGKRS